MIGGCWSASHKLLDSKHVNSHELLHCQDKPGIVEGIA